MLSFLTDHSWEAEMQSSGKSGDVNDVATPPPVHALENIAIEPLGRAQLTDLCVPRLARDVHAIWFSGETRLRRSI